jgi:hypothetical protein
VLGPTITKGSAPKAPKSPLNARDCFEIRARHEIEPFQQGGLDGLCGLYSAINVLRLALHDSEPLNKAAAKYLLALGAAYLDRKHTLSSALADGMQVRRWHGLVRYLAKHVATQATTIEIERPIMEGKPTITDVFDGIVASLAQNKPVLINLAGALNHFSIVAASTPTTLQLFDSSGHRYLRRASCGIRTGYHHIPPKALLRLAVQRR